MNNHSRKDLRTAMHFIGRANELIAAIKDVEVEKYNKLPESIRESKRGERFWENIDNLYSAIYNLEGAMEYVDNAINQ
jgi:hypothetical protein